MITERARLTSMSSINPLKEELSRMTIPSTSTMRLASVSGSSSVNEQLIAKTAQDKDTLDSYGKLQAQIIKQPTSTFVIPQFIIPPDEKVESWDFKEGNIQMDCFRYVGEVFQYYSELEKKIFIRTNYIDLQKGFTADDREAVIDLLVQIHYAFKAAKLNLNPDSLYLAVNMIDRFLSLSSLSKQKLPLLAIACLYIACKFEETQYPSAVHLKSLTKAFPSLTDLYVMERLVLDKLRFKLGLPTAFTFLKRFSIIAELDQSLGLSARYICEQTLSSYHISTSYLPSMVAASSVALSLLIHNKRPWSATLAFYTGYEWEQMRHCLTDIVELLKKAPNLRYKSTYLKYAERLYLNISEHVVSCLST
ncbi:putative G2/mitotic-specific cyclin-B [Monocercomonoides exilis]|uniref:putative G2/mitotic-specific cyclin-B n=1 Tax=Monocercomonoides exilis TaxID=2049356 RepID=UPI00355A0A5B|nr:putative G2/mitotic-specific cyclin-B [Monocercomonoides exilis]